MSRMLVLGALVCAASPGLAHKVQVDFDHGIRFSSYKTYRWVDLEGSPSPEPLFPNQLMRERLVGLIEEALAARMSLPGREKALIAVAALAGIGRRRTSAQSSTGRP